MLTVIQNNIPYTTHTIISHIILRHETKVLMTQYEAIRKEENTQGWTLQLYRTYLQIRERLHRQL